MKKIVIIGPESTGKSTLCQQLADHYNTSCCPEYAREFLTKNGSKYSYDDLLIIAKGQIALEDQVVLKNQSLGKDQPLFIDTDMYVMKVWCEFVFGKCHRFILDNIIERRYDLYLLCNTDLPWTKDELREYPELASRNILYNMYKDCMINQSTPWISISGGHENRLASAIAAVNHVLAPVQNPGI
jgi:NadR type nicotinamide-nucleotide adenylyltransferase